MSWQPLAESDPLPGDPDAVAGAATTLSLTGGDLAVQATAIGGVDPGRAFVGLAAERFAALRDRSATQVAAAGDRCAEAGASLSLWSAALAAAQEAGRAALALAVQAADDRAAAQAGLERQRAVEVAARARADTLDALFPDLPARQPEPWVGPDWAAALADAGADLARAEAMLALALAARDRDAATAVAGLSEAVADALHDDWWVRVTDRFHDVGVDGSAGRGPGGLDALDFVATADGLVLNTAAGWRYQAYVEAGIDPAAWRPGEGLEANDATARAAWDYYRTLYFSDPERYQWAGLAWFAGATVYAGVQDLSVTADALRRAGDLDGAREVLAAVFPQAVIPLLVADASVPQVAAELDEVEAEMMGMQRQVFDDIAWQHVAFREGGLPAMAALRRSGALGPRQMQAWRDIDSRDPARVARANRNIAYVEQHDVLGDDFTRLRLGHGVVGHGVTLATSVVAESPVPGGRPFRDVVPYEVVVDLPDRVTVVPDRAVPDRVPLLGWQVPGGDGVHVDTPDEAHLADVPVNDVSLFRNRWAWVTDDMLPAYRRFVAAGGWRDYAQADLAALARDRRVVDDDLLAYTP
jgi:hypothetical protein